VTPYEPGRERNRSLLCKECDKPFTPGNWGLRADVFCSRECMEITMARVEAHLRFLKRVHGKG
jgi:hypothetical protein